MAAAVAVGGLATAAQSDARPSYDEPLRPQIHFTPAENWLNDPNGLVYVRGQYHLFYQYNPLGETWGHMSWGHAVSADLLHWRELPVAIPEDERYMIFSGSVVVDEGNTSGFGVPGAAPLVAVYTGAERQEGGLQNQHLAYSTDGGQTWTKYSGNPVLDLGLANFRDPKVFWHAPTNRWVMAAVASTRHQVALFGSPDLKHWTHLSDFGPAGAADGAWECPDLFPLHVAGSNDTRWILKVDVFKSAVAPGSGAQYFVGRFDGVEFVADPTSRAGTVDYGRDFYAAASWSHLPDAANHHIWIGWMSNHHYASDVPTSPWRGAMTLPREVSLRSDAGEWRLLQAPVPAVETLRGRHVHIAGRLEDTVRRLPLSRGAGNTAELQARFTQVSASEFGIRVHVGAGQATEIGFDRARGELYVDRSHSGVIPNAEFAGRSAVPLTLGGNRLQLRIWVDRSSVEVFEDDGGRVLTELVFPGPLSDGIEVFARGGAARVDSLDVWALESVVPKGSRRRPVVPASSPSAHP